MQATEHARECLAVLAFVVAALQTPLTTSPVAREMTAGEILGRMTSTYVGCRTYRDSGLVTTIYHPAGRDDHTETLAFTTAFVRPDGFRFEFQDREEGELVRYLICCRGERVRSWWDVNPGVREPHSLIEALRGATGVSGASAQTVPALLLETTIVGPTVSELGEPQRIEDADIDGAKCFRLQGRSGSDLVTLWIDQRTGLLRKIEETSRFDDFWTETTTDYTPEVDVPIEEHELRFDPPARR